MSMYLYQRTGLNHYIKMTDKWYVNVYGTLTNQICIPEEIKSKLNSRNSCCPAVQYLLSPI
jgi:hypothetical protein